MMQGLYRNKFVSFLLSFQTWLAQEIARVSRSVKEFDKNLLIELCENSFECELADRKCVGKMAGCDATFSNIGEEFPNQPDPIRHPTLSIQHWLYFRF